MDIASLGGIERVVCNLSTALIENGFQIRIISLFKSNDCIKYPISSEVNIIYIYNFNIINYRLNFLRFLFSKNFKKYISCNSITISTYSVFSILIAIFRRKTSKSVIASEHSAFSAHSKIIQVLRLFFYRYLRNVVVLTNYDFLTFSRYLKNVVLIPNAVTDFKTDKQFSKKNYQSEFKCIAVGRFSKVKRYHLFIELAAHVFQLNRQICFELIGSGPELDFYKALVLKYGGMINIKITDSNNNISNLYNSASILIITSETEAFPMVLIEANSFGIPVISVECPIGPLEMILDNFNGYKYPEQDFIRLASDKIVELFNDRQLLSWLSEASVKSSLLFTNSNVVDRWVSIL